MPEDLTQNFDQALNILSSYGSSSIDIEAIASIMDVYNNRLDRISCGAKKENGEIMPIEELCDQEIALVA